MALDTKEKRQNAIGHGRPFLRNHFPVATPDQEWRVASGLAWGGNALETVSYDLAPSAGTLGRFTTWGPFSFDYGNPIPPGFGYWSNLKETIYGSDAGDIISINNHRELSLWESIVIVDTSSQAISVKLPAGAGENHTVTIMATSANNNVTITLPSGTIQGVSTYTVSGAYGWVTVKLTGSDWQVFDPQAKTWMEADADYETISGNDAATDVTAAELEELTDGSTTTLHKHAPTYKTANGVTIIDSNGTSSDTVSDLQAMFDGNVYQLAEVTGAPGQQLEIDFTGVTSISAIALRLYYVGSVSHAIRIQLYNYDTTTWDTIHTITDGLDYESHFKSVPDDTNYISSGNAVIRLYHTESGNASHDTYIDYVGLRE